jgi:hypothetical protein
MMHLEGTPSDQLPGVLATGRADVRLAFVSLSRRHPEGRDAEAMEWHAMDHRPEQYRLAGLRNSLRLVSTPACRSTRAASAERFDAVDFVMTYLFSTREALAPFLQLGGALRDAGRMPLLLPNLGMMTADLAGTAAAPRAVVGADVIPWRPAHGIYLMIEQGVVAAGHLIDVPGVAGVWWYHGLPPSTAANVDARGWQITYCYIDEDPVAVGKLLGERMKQRWASGQAKGLLAAPFFVVQPFEWSRHVP